MRNHLTLLLVTLTLTLCACGPVEELADDADIDDPIDAVEPEDDVDTSADPLAAPAAAGVEHRAFRVMSYNVRGPVDPGSHAWNVRRPKVIALILENDPDIVGVQEAQKQNGFDIPADLIAGLKGRYDYYSYGGGSPKIIFYRRGRFTRVSAGNNALPNPYSESNVCHSRSNGKKLSWVKLTDALTGKQYFIGNTHLAFSAACDAGRRAQAKALKTLVEQKSAGLPVVVMGDFNSDDQAASGDEGVIDLLESGGTRTLFRTARFDGTTGPSDATFNSRWNGSGTNKARLDFIFHSGRDITSGSPAIDRSPGTDTGTPSDHFPILATIRPALFAPSSQLAQVTEGDRAETKLFFADIDGDQCADLVSWTHSLGDGETYWSRSRCNGTFTAPAELGGATSKVASTRFYFADVTGDGCADKVFWRPTYAGGAIRVYKSRCNGSFDGAVELAVTKSESERTQFFFAKVTSDRCADLVRWNPGQNDGRITVYPSACNGTVTFSKGIESTDGRVTAGATDLWFADVDGDGRDDQIAWHPDAAGGRTRVYRSVSSGKFDKVFEHSAGSSGNDASRFFFADVNGDKRADKVFWRPDFRQGRAQVYLSTGSNFAGSPMMDNGAYSQSENTRFFYADVDKSGAADKVYWNPGSNAGAARVYVSRN